jgi:hypothetical protein
VFILVTAGSWDILATVKVEIFLEQREVAFLSPSKICENLNFSTEIQIFANFSG